MKVKRNFEKLKEALIKSGDIDNLIMFQTVEKKIKSILILET